MLLLLSSRYSRFTNIEFSVACPMRMLRISVFTNIALQVACPTSRLCISVRGFSQQSGGFSQQSDKQVTVSYQCARILQYHHLHRYTYSIPTLQSAASHQKISLAPHALCNAARSQMPGTRTQYAGYHRRSAARWKRLVNARMRMT